MRPIRYCFPITFQYFFIDYFYHAFCPIVRHVVIAAYNVFYVKCHMNMIQILPDNRIDKNYWTIDTKCDLRGLVKGYIL